MKKGKVKEQETVIKVVGKLECIEPKSEYLVINDLRALDINKLLAEKTIVKVENEKIAYELFKYIRDCCQTNDEMLGKITRWYGVTKYKISKFHNCWIGLDLKVFWDNYNISYEQGYLMNNKIYFVENRETIKWNEEKKKVVVVSDIKEKEEV